ncbi:MAG: hypothetical protein EOO09_22850 [Chitinophagaceae bacterium]|nr:MAG: hypothetical protein EOO09_22850 [Chitinophagaceae bacterium]
MKTSFKNVLAIGALLSIPATFCAVGTPVTGEYGLLGSANTSTYTGSLAVGYNNVVNITTANAGAAAIGNNLRVKTLNCLVVGKTQGAVIKKVPAKGGISMGGYLAN